LKDANALAVRCGGNPIVQYGSIRGSLITRGLAMHGIIYLVGLVVVILAILSFFGLH
jgi:hypothetical protein